MVCLGLNKSYWFFLALVLPVSLVGLDFNKLLDLTETHYSISQPMDHVCTSVYWSPHYMTAYLHNIELNFVTSLYTATLLHHLSPFLNMTDFCHWKPLYV